MRYDRCLVDTFLIGDELSSSLRLEAAEFDLPLASGISNAGKAPELHDASLPQAGTSFIGRSAELTELRDLLHDPHTRLLTLVGPGGIGKTRLALELARQLQDGSVTYMDLQQVDDPILVPTAMAMALKLKPSSTPNALEILRNALSDSAHVILLDNFEQVLDAGNVLTTLLEACPKAKFVVTSRERLAQPSEVLYPVDGLHFAEEASDAVKLFNSRARQANARFRPSPGNLTFILEICRLVESSPLAIELAAAWLRSVPVEQIAAELQRGPELLEEGVGKGRRSLRAIFEESYKRLNEKERELLSSVSVFRGGFTRADALQMMDAPLRTLLGLADAAMLRLTPQGRYVHHPVLQHFAREKLLEAPTRKASSNAAFRVGGAPRLGRTITLDRTKKVRRIGDLRSTTTFKLP